MMMFFLVATVECFCSIAILIQVLDVKTKNLSDTLFKEQIHSAAGTLTTSLAPAITMNGLRSVCTLILYMAAVFYFVVRQTNAVTSQGKCLTVDGPSASCSCVMNGSEPKQFVNIGALRNSSSDGPRFTTRGLDKQRDWHFSYNPCVDFSMFVGENATSTLPCNDSAVARWTDLSADKCNSLGSQSSASFVYKWPHDNANIVSNLTLRFEDEKDRKHYGAIISLVCNTSIARNASTFKYINNVHAPRDIWYFVLESECCCPGMCGVPPSAVPLPSKSNEEVWKIIVIVLGACLLVLLAILLGCCVIKKQRKGYQAI